MLGAIPLFDGATYSFDEYYRRSFQQISRSAGKHILFQRTGNPKFSDPLYGEMQSQKKAKEDAQLSKQWEREFSSLEAEENQRITQCIAWTEKFELQTEDLPCFVFVTQQGEKVGVLRLAHRWYQSESSWRVFCRCFCSWLERKDVMRLAATDLDPAVLSKRMARLLGKLTQVVDKQLLLSETTNGEPVGDRVQPGAYCQVVTEQGRESLTRAKYERLVAQSSDFDLFIDGFTREAKRRSSEKNEMLESTLTPVELAMVQEYMCSRKPLRPGSTRVADKRGLSAPIKTFESARRKVDVKSDAGEFQSFHVRSSPDPQNKSFEFCPPPKMRYCLILPS